MANQDVILPSNPNDIKKIMGKMIEIDGAMTRIVAERDLIKATIKDLSSEFQLPAKFLNKFARDYHKQNFKETLGANDEYCALVATLVPSVIE
jgi:hypothetical protein